jgi:hypothetical protein
MGVTESNTLEEVEPKIAISPSTQTKHSSKQLIGGLGPRIANGLLNQGLLMSKLLRK